MRTTLNIEDRLAIEAKALAAQQRTSLTALIEEGLREVLERRDPARPSGHRMARPPLPISTRGGGLQPGVDASNNSSLVDAMEQGVPAEQRR